MNYPITVVALITFLAFLAHIVVGNREALRTRPRRMAIENEAEAALIERNWVQSLCAFQLVTVDLLVLSVLLFVLGASEMLPNRRAWALIAAAFFSLWSGAWVIQLLILRRSLKDYLLVGQWAVWLVCAGLLVWGAQSL